MTSSLIASGISSYNNTTESDLSSSFDEEKNHRQNTEEQKEETEKTLNLENDDSTTYSPVPSVRTAVKTSNDHPYQFETKIIPLDQIMVFGESDSGMYQFNGSHLENIDQSGITFRGVPFYQFVIKHYTS